MREFLRKNVNLYHFIGMILFTILAVFYWYKSGKYSDNILKNNILLMIVWGLAVGYITADMVSHAMKRKDNEE